jgi:hypothetical protein
VVEYYQTAAGILLNPGFNISDKYCHGLQKNRNH